MFVISLHCSSTVTQKHANLLCVSCASPFLLCSSDTVDACGVGSGSEEEEEPEEGGATAAAAVALDAAGSDADAADADAFPCSYCGVAYMTSRDLQVSRDAVTSAGATLEIKNVAFTRGRNWVVCVCVCVICFVCVREFIACIGQ